VANRIKLAIFDIYGTTLEDAGQVPAAFRTALQAGGLEYSSEQLSAVRGASKREAIAKLLENRFGPTDPDIAARTEAVYGAFRKELLELFQKKPIAFIPGAVKTFQWLRQNGVALALNTGFDRVIAETIVDRLPWRGCFVDAVVCGDDVHKGRPAPDMIFNAMQRTGVGEAARVMTIGDTTKDLEAGNNAGVGINIGVLSGAHERERLQKVAHTQILASVADVPAWLEAHPDKR